MKAENTTKIQFDSLSINEAYARSVVAAFLARYDPTVPQLADLKTAVSEAVTNCIVHAYPDRIGPVTLCVAVYPEREVHITVTDKGVGIPDVPQAMEPRQIAAGAGQGDQQTDGVHQCHGEGQYQSEIGKIDRRMAVGKRIAHGWHLPPLFCAQMF